MNRKYIFFTTYIIIGLLLLSLPLGTSYLKTNQEYNAFNFNNNGCSNFGKLVYNIGGSVIPLLYIDSKYSTTTKNSVLIIISPDIQYTNNEINNMKKFLENGNTIIIADNKGVTNNIYDKLNLSIKIVPKKVNDLFYIKNEKLLITPYTNFNENLLLYNPSEIQIINNTNNNTVLVKTSKLSNKNILVKSKYNKGEIIVISDPNIFINLLSKYNNKFLENLMENYAGKTIYIDESHKSNGAVYDLVTGSIYTLSNNIKFGILVFLSIIVFLGDYLLVKLENIFRNRKKIDLENIIKKYPTINRDKLEMFFDELKK